MPGRGPTPVSISSRRPYEGPPPAPMRLAPELAPAFHALRDVTDGDGSEGGPTSGLGELVFLVSGTCNMACTYCYANQGAYVDQPATHMTSEAAVRGTDVAVERFGTVRAVKFLGGEPSLNPQAIEAVAARFRAHREDGTVERLPRYGSITNLLHLTDEFLDVVRRHDVELTASIDGPADVHDRQRPRVGGQGTFDQVVDNLRRLQHETGQPTGAECVYTPWHHRLGITPAEIADQLHALGVGQVLIHPLVDADSLREHSREQVDAYVADLRGLQRAAMSAEVVRLACDPGADPAVVRAAVERTRARSRWHCGMGQTTFTIDVSGEVWSCYMCIGLEGHRLGSALDERGAVDFDGVTRARDGFTKDTHPVCGDCDLREPCTGCLGQMFHQAGDGEVFRPVRATCEWLAGTIDGVLEGLLRVRAAGQWEPLLARLGVQSDHPDHEEVPVP